MDKSLLDKFQYVEQIKTASVVGAVFSYKSVILECFPCNPDITFVFKSNIEHENNRPLIFGVMGGKMNAPINWNLMRENDYMKRALIGGFLSLIGSIWSLAIVFIAGSNLATVTVWDPKIGRLWTTVIEMDLMFLFVIAVVFIVLGIILMAIEFFRKEK